MLHSTVDSEDTACRRTCEIAESDTDCRIITSNIASNNVPVTRPRATPHADTTSIPAAQARHGTALQTRV